MLEESIALNPEPKIRSQIKFSNRAAGEPDLHDSIIRELLTTVPEDVEEYVEVPNEAIPEQQDPAAYKAKVKVLAEWNSLGNIDEFLELVYEYYRERGHQQLVLSGFSSLAKLAFMIVFAAMLVYAIDWSFLNSPASFEKHPKLWQVMSLWNFMTQLSLFGLACLLVFGGFWLIQCFRFWTRLPDYDRVARFYRFALGIEDEELGFAVDFGEVCHRLHRFHEANKVACERLNEQDICNRIMRRDNYLIALYNRKLLDFTKNLPFPFGSNAVLHTRILEWNLGFGLLGFVFDGGQEAKSTALRGVVLKTTQREVLAAELKKRFQLLAIINLVLAPFVLVFIGVYYLFRYGEEVYRNPNSILGRQFTLSARWNLREFNELEHLLDRRLAASHKPAEKYLQATMESAPYAALLKFVSFVAGSVVLVLLAVTVVNEDLLMHFELTPGKSVIWYLGLFGAVLAISRALTPAAAKFRADKRDLLDRLRLHLHFSPEAWQPGYENSREARDLLAALFVPRYVLFLRECLGLLTNPLVLYFAIPNAAEELIDFFREFTVGVEGLGYVCSFAQFDLQRHGQESGLLAANEEKLEKSVIAFKSNYPHWRPAQETTAAFLQRLSETARHERDEKSLLYSSSHIEDEREELTASVMSILDRYKQK